ncbi:HET-domain-containing protein [Rhizodiscina lignyota]|uniref:HET-domain-containing protein n=1 Tax=Rhizodiscina lignyota TaxID=1504668 RepID=A0A9P4M328_9PEZI|nr:HET-domain-containing protein [Rhizodiscina lignyota]
METTYKYTPLSRDRTIRVFRLLTPRWFHKRDRIEINISELSLDDNPKKYTHSMGFKDDSPHFELDLTLDDRVRPPVQYAIKRPIKNEYTYEALCYKALSYVWGAKDPPHSVYCSGKQIRVTRNCYDALQQIRKRQRTSKEEHILWIDAICINQNDILERNEQVKLMADVYSKANEVLVWLSTSEQRKPPRLEGNRTAFDPRSALGQARDSVMNYTALVANDMIPAPIGNTSPPDDSRIWESDIWKRLWTAQEMVLAQKCVMLVGSSEVLWHILDYVKERGPRRDPSSNIFINEDNEGSWSPWRFRRESLSLTFNGPVGRPPHKVVEILVNGAWGSSTTDAKDKVYALHGLAQRCGLKLVDPDYGKTVSQVYQDATVAVLEFCQYLDFFAFAPTPHGNDLPSWTIDWDSSYDYYTVRRVFQKALPLRWSDDGSYVIPCQVKFTVGRPFIAERNEVNNPSNPKISNVNGQLVLRGAVIGHIILKRRPKRAGSEDAVRAEVSETTLAFLRFNALRKWLPSGFPIALYLYKLVFAEMWDPELRRLPRGDEISDDYKDSGTMLCEMWYNAITKLDGATDDMVKQVQEEMAAPEGRIGNESNGLSFEDERDTRIARWLIGQKPTSWMEVPEEMAQMLEHFSLCSTSTGRACLASDQVRSGDHILLLEGARCPYIARKEDDTYKLKAWAWIEGAMDGEFWPEHEAELETMRIG